VQCSCGSRLVWLWAASTAPLELAVIACAVDEHHWLGSLGSEAPLVRGMRYVDDSTLVALHLMPSLYRLWIVTAPHATAVAQCWKALGTAVVGSLKPLSAC